VIIMNGKVIKKIEIRLSYGGGYVLLRFGRGK
jgi:hypothetical protein